MLEDCKVKIQVQLKVDGYKSFFNRGKIKWKQLLLYLYWKSSIV